MVLTKTMKYKCCLRNDLLHTSNCVHSIRLEAKSCRILPLTYGAKYDMT